MAPAFLRIDIHTESRPDQPVVVQLAGKVDRVRRLLAVTAIRSKPTRFGLDFLPVDRVGEQGHVVDWFGPVRNLVTSKPGFRRSLIANVWCSLSSP